MSPGVAQNHIDEGGSRFDAPPSVTAATSFRPFVPDSRLKLLATPASAVGGARSEPQQQETKPSRILNSVKNLVGALSFTSTAIVASELVALPLAAFFSADPFSFFRTHPGWAFSAAVAHVWVLVLSATAGVGFARHKKHERELENLGLLHLETTATHEALVGKVTLRIKHVVGLTDEISKLIGDVKGETQGLSIRSDIDALCRSAGQLCLTFRYFRKEDFANHCLENGVPAVVMTRIGKLGDRVSECKSSISTLEGQLGDQVTAQSHPKLFRLILLTRTLAQILSPEQADSSAGERRMQVELEKDALLQDLRDLQRQSERWKEYHAELRKKNPIWGQGASTTLVRDIIDNIEDLVDEANTATQADQIASMQAGVMQVHEQVLRLSLSVREDRLSTEGRDALNQGLRLLSAAMGDDPIDTIKLNLKAAKQYLEKLLVSIKASKQTPDLYGRFYVRFNSRILAFEKQFPDLSARTSVVQYVASIGYWISCSECLDQLIPGDRTDIRFYIFKYAATFVIYNFLDYFPKVVIGDRFKPEIVAAAFDLSKWTLHLMAPFAWVYRKLQTTIGGRVEKIRDRRIRERFGRTDQG